MPNTADASVKLPIRELMVEGLVELSPSKAWQTCKF